MHKDKIGSRTNNKVENVRCEPHHTPHNIGMLKTNKFMSSDRWDPLTLIYQVGPICQ